MPCAQVGYIIVCITIGILGKTNRVSLLAYHLIRLSGSGPAQSFNALALELELSLHKFNHLLPRLSRTISGGGNHGVLCDIGGGRALMCGEATSGRQPEHLEL